MSRWARPTRYTWWAMAFAVAATAGTTAFLAYIYPSLPFGVPVRFELGQALILQAKTPRTVMLPALIQASLLLVFGAVILLLLWRASPATADPHTQQDGLRMRLVAEGIAMLAAIWILMQGLGAVRLVLLWQRGRGGYGMGYTIAMVTAIVISVVICARTMKLVDNQRRVDPPVDDPSLWRLRHLYFNPHDPGLFVPTRTGGGWTLNFGRPVAIFLLGVTLVAGIALPYVVARLILRLGW